MTDCSDLICRPWIGAMVACVLALGLLSPQASARGGDPWDLLAGMPGEVTLAIVVNNAAEQLGSDHGRGLHRFMLDAGLLADTVKAWQGLATTLEYRSFDESLRALLGRRVIFVVGAPEPGRDRTAWVLITEVDRATEVKLRKLIKAVPRSRRNGRFVMGIEDGKYELTIVNRDEHGGRATMLLAPAGAGLLFDRAVRMLQGKPEDSAPTLAASPLFEHARTVGRGEVVLYWTPGADGPGDDSGRTFLAISANHTPKGWSAKLLAGPEPRREGGAITLPVGVLGDQSDNRLVSMAFVGAPELSADDERMALGLWTGQVGLGGWFEHTAGYSAMRVDVQREGGHATAAFDLAFGITEDATAAVCDAFMNSVLAPMTAAVGQSPPAFDGVYPLAVRTHDIEFNAGGPAELFGQHTQIAWRGAATDARPARMAVSLASRDVGLRVSGLQRELAELDAAESSGLVSVGRVRPAALHEAFGGTQLFSMPILGAMEWIRRIEWAMALEPAPADEGQTFIRGTLDIQIKPAAWSKLGGE